jgi:ABC-type antimicrobial peptide transport system permease subunit
MDASIVSERIVAMLSGLFGGLGSALAALGLYGLLAYTVARRTHEIGIRMALGATEGDVARMVLKGALGLVAAGLLVGAPLVFLSRRFAATLLENLAVESAMPLAFSAAVLVAVALAAAYVPARRASRVAPVVALRQE